VQPILLSIPSLIFYHYSAAYKLFQILIEESDRAIHRSSEVFEDIVVIAIVGVEVGDAVCVTNLPGKRHL
jgi:hypothetical protein